MVVGRKFWVKFFVGATSIVSIGRVGGGNVWSYQD